MIWSVVFVDADPDVDANVKNDAQDVDVALPERVLEVFGRVRVGAGVDHLRLPLREEEDDEI